MKERFKAILTSRKFYFSIGGIFVSALLLLLLFNQVVMPWYTNYAEGLTVPDVTRMPLDEAKATLAAYGLRYEVADRRTNALYPAGFVTDQNPRPSEIVKPNRKIYLTVNMEYHPTVEVPEVVNLSLRNAKIQLQNSGLKIGTISYESSRFKNTVLRQSIKAEEVVEKGTSIDLAIGDGLGERMVAIPDIIGLGLTAAQQELRRAGLRIGEIRYRPKQNVAPNVVIAFSPDEDRVVIGTTLKLIVSQKASRPPLQSDESTGNNE